MLNTKQSKLIHGVIALKTFDKIEILFGLFINENLIVV